MLHVVVCSFVPLPPHAGSVRVHCCIPFLARSVCSSFLMGCGIGHVQQLRVCLVSRGLRLFLLGLLLLFVMVHMVFLIISLCPHFRCLSFRRRLIRVVLRPSTSQSFPLPFSWLYGPIRCKPRLRKHCLQLVAQSVTQRPPCPKRALHLFLEATGHIVFLCSQCKILLQRSPPWSRFSPCPRTTRELCSHSLPGASSFSSRFHPLSTPPTFFSPSVSMLLLCAVV